MRFEDAARGGAPLNDDERNAFVLGFKKSVSDVIGYCHSCDAYQKSLGANLGRMVAQA